MKRKKFLPFALPDLDDSELELVRTTLESGWLTMGRQVQTFEKEFAGYLGARHALAVNSCTAALHLALDAAGVRMGDFVLTTPYTFAATAEVIHYLRATPVFVDVDARTFNLDPLRLAETVEELDGALKGREPKTTPVQRALAAHRAAGLPGGREPRIRAVIPVHLAGLSCRMKGIDEVARRHGLAVVEDAAHALPSSYEGRTIGSSGGDVPRAVCFSFYATKTLTTGEGGMVTTDDPEWAERIQIMRLHGITKDAWNRYAAEGDWRYEIVAPGFKYNTTDIAAAMGLAQLGKTERMWRRRCKIARRYTEALRPLGVLETPAEPEHARDRHAWHLYMLRLNLEGLSIDRGRFIEELKDRNVSAGVHYIPLHLHPWYRNAYGFEPEDFPSAHREYRREISLPIYSRMSDQDVEDVVAAVTEVAVAYERKKRYASA